MDVDDVCATGQAEQCRPGARVARRRPTVRLDRVELDPVTPLEPGPGLRGARTGDVDREAPGRQALDEADDMARDAAVGRLRGHE
jgi:hypothetical protein